MNKRRQNVKKYMEKTLLCKYMNKKTSNNYLISEEWFSNVKIFIFFNLLVGKLFIFK